MFSFPPDLPPPYQREYAYPSYDAPRYPDMRPPVGLTPLSPGMLDFRMQRFIHDWAPPSPAPPSNLIGMTLNSLPADVRARMGGMGG
jgi:hypothetical protein